MTPTCTAHTGEPAPWVCSVCARQLCPDCAARRPLKFNEAIIVCVECGSPARVITKPKRIAPYWEAFGTFLRNMVTTEGLLQIAAVGIMIYLTGLLPGRVGLTLSTFVYVSYFFHVIARAAVGEESLPLPADFLGAESFLVIGRYGFASLIIWGPALAYALWGVSLWELTNNPAHVLMERLIQPTVFLLMGIGMFYYPVALIAGAVANSLLAMFNPLITFRLIARIPGQYTLTVVVVGALSVGGLFWGVFIDALVGITPVAFVAAAIGEALKLPPHLLTAFVLGRLIFQNAEHFGVVKEEFLVEPVFPDAEPRGTREAINR